MVRSPAPLPIDLRLGAFPTARSATSIDPNRFRRSDLVAPTRGVRLHRDLADDVFERVRGFALVLGPSQVLSHTTAALVLGLPLPRRFERASADVHVTTLGRGPLMRRAGVVAHRADADRVGIEYRRGIRLTDAVATWYACRLLLGPEELVVLGDDVVGRGLATLDDLRRACRAGDRGVGVARSAIDRVRVGSESPMETRFRLIVVAAGFPEPELNVDVLDADGRFLGRADLSWPGLRIAIEYDGDHHRTDRATFHGDRRRGNGFAANGWIVIHVTSVDVDDPGAALARLDDAFRARGWGGAP